MGKMVNADKPALHLIMFFLVHVSRKEELEKALLYHSDYFRSTIGIKWLREDG